MLVVRRVLTQLDQDAEKHLSVGLRRFDQSYDRDNAEDALIDLVVALESSLLADNSEQDQLQYKMSLRGAALLASSAPPQKTQRQIRALYTARSKIVHSGKHLTDNKIKKLFADLEPPVDVHEIVDFSQKITRALLLEYVSRLNESNSLATVNKELDEKIVNSLALSSASYEADHPSN